MTGMDVPWKFLPSIFVCVCRETCAKCQKKIVEVLYHHIEVLHEWPKMSCADASIHKIKSGYT